MTILYKEWKENKAQFKRLSFHVQNLIPPIKYMKRWMFESIKSDMSNLGRQMNEDRMAHMWTSTLERLCFKRRTSHVPPGRYSLEFLGVCRPGPGSWKDD